MSNLIDWHSLFVYMGFWMNPGGLVKTRIKLDTSAKVHSW